MYLVYLHNLAVHKDHLPHHQLYYHLLTVGNIIKCLPDDISGPYLSLMILAPELGGAVPLNDIYQNLI